MSSQVTSSPSWRNIRQSMSLTTKIHSSSSITSSSRMSDCLAERLRLTHQTLSVGTLAAQLAPTFSTGPTSSFKATCSHSIRPISRAMQCMYARLGKRMSALKLSKHVEVVLSSSRTRLQIMGQLSRRQTAVQSRSSAILSHQLPRLTLGPRIKAFQTGKR